MGSWNERYLKQDHKEWKIFVTLFIFHTYSHFIFPCSDSISPSIIFWSLLLETFSDTDKFHSIFRGNVSLETKTRVCNAKSAGLPPELLYTSKGLQEYKTPSLREAQEKAESVMCSDARKQQNVTFLYQQLNHTVPWINCCQLQHSISATEIRISNNYYQKTDCS